MDIYIGMFQANKNVNNLLHNETFALLMKKKNLKLNKNPITKV